jgi:glycosyltransferase involved in cell wall biosynthesis
MADKSAMQEVKVSVIIPTYNAARFVTTAIDSVLAQTFKDFEILVIDDGSTDNTREILEKYDSPQIHYLHKKNGGVSSARN